MNVHAKMEVRRGASAMGALGRPPSPIQRITDLKMLTPFPGEWKKNGKNGKSLRSILEDPEVGG